MSEIINKELSFEDAMKELEKISNAMASGTQSLDESIELYSRGVKLVAFCREKLDTAERKIKIVIDKANAEVIDYNN